MDSEEFNELLQNYKYDSAAKDKFCRYCLAKIIHRLICRGMLQETESLAHSILRYFLEHLKATHVISPKWFINKSVDNYLSNLKKKEKRRRVRLDDVGYYEQRFDKLEETEIYKMLVDVLGEENAQILYLHYVDKVKEKDIAKQLNLNYATVRQRVKRETAKFKKYYEKYVTKD